MPIKEEKDFKLSEHENAASNGTDELIFEDKSAKSNVVQDLSKLPDKLPVLPLKDMVVYPYMIFPILAGRESTIKAINKSIDSDKYILLVTQVDEKIEEPTYENLNETGTIAKILQVLRLPNGLIKVLVDGIAAAKIKKYHTDEFITAEVSVKMNIYKDDVELKAYVRKATKLFTDYINNNKSIPQESLVAYDNIKEADRKFYYIASTLNIETERKQALLEIDDIHKQFEEILYLMTSELEIMNVEKDIDSKIFQTMQKNQRKFIVQEQIRILQEELGDGYETDPDLVKLRDQIENVGMPDHVKEKAMEEFSKLKKTPPMSPDFSVLRNYLDWMVNVPWSAQTDDNFDLTNAKKILDNDHYGLDKPKDRIIELMAVLKLLKQKNITTAPKGQILCFVGPPGVGKTSLGKSIAKALDRKFTRISVGGVRDESEIRGHRRTYIGSMPGKIITAMRKAGTSNPVILIDEIDKMSSDFRGDPASAMLEVLDPEQNYAFNDHYLDVDYDLSRVLFITTANVQYNIPLPLQDRMEIIEMRSYLDFEKLQIAKRHIIPKEVTEHGLDENSVVFSDDMILKIINEYTREAGVRNLERELSTVIRKVVKEVVIKNDAAAAKEKDNKKASKTVKKEKEEIVTVDEEMIHRALGVPKYKKKSADKIKSKVGSIVGLAWTSVGGDVLHVDVSIMKGASKLTLTGQLGDVMKESAFAGYSYLKANSKKFKIPENYFKDKEIHIHLPEGAIPKDGPSAGITMIMAMLSAITKTPAKTDVAMTGEITLRGSVLPIGGLNEKLLAAVRNGIKTVLIPKDNEKDLSEIVPEIKENLIIVPVENVSDALKYVFGSDKLQFKK
ncbi:endopeptidase La [soil metagenome]